MMPPQPVSSASLQPVREEPEDDTESLSDIVSISGESTGGEMKNVSVSGKSGGRGRKSKKKEINL